MTNFQSALAYIIFVATKEYLPKTGQKETGAYENIEYLKWLVFKLNFTVFLTNNFKKMDI